jgi:hypothetical protein
MNYLYVLCMILMILSYILYMTLVMFIYMYYKLFACTNLVDVMSLFFTVFSFHLPNFDKNRSVFNKNRPKLAMPGFEKKPTDLSVKPAAFRCSYFHYSSSVRFS